MSDFEVQKSQVADWNAKNKWKKRGITMIPTKYGISFTGLSKNQGGALVHVWQTIINIFLLHLNHIFYYQIYLDGSVLISHGGTEMGQGLLTKTMQVASKVLDIPIEKIHYLDTATDKVILKQKHKLQVLISTALPIGISMHQGP